MRTRFGVRLGMGLLIALAGATACDDKGATGPSTQETFTASLTGAAERPNPVTTSATGNASVTWNATTGTFSYTMNVSNLTGVTGAHIHGPATVDQAAGVLVPLTAPVSANVSGTFAAAQITAAGVSVDSLLSLMRTGRTYVNVHTAANPAGEIRGQLIRQ
jgi:hypothetical protein